MDFKIDNIIMQIGNAEAVPGISAADYAPTTDIPFLVKNDGTDNVTLEVKYANGTAWVSTVFQPGWNPDVIKAIKTNAATLNLKRSI